LSITSDIQVTAVLKTNHSGKIPAHNWCFTKSIPFGWFRLRDLLLCVVRYSLASTPVVDDGNAQDTWHGVPHLSKYSHIYQFNKHTNFVPGSNFHERPQYDINSCII